MSKLSVRWRLGLDSQANSHGNKTWQRDISDIVERVLGPHLPPKPPRPEVFGQCMYYLELAEVALRGNRKWPRRKEAMTKCAGK